MEIIINPMESYNRLLVKGIPDLPYIEYFKNNKININSNLFSKKAAEQLSTYILNQNLVNSQCKFCKIISRTIRIL